MIFKIASSLLAFAALVAAQADPSINSPASVVQCQPVQLSWTATKEPVFISVIPGGQPGAAPLEDFGAQPAGQKSLTWVVDMPAGSSITMQIRDSTGAVAYSGNLNVQDSADDSCVRPDAPPPGGGASTTAPAASSAPATTQSSAPASSASRTSAATQPAANTSRPPATATTAQPSNTNAAATSNAALAGISAEWTGMLGLVAAVIGLAA